MEPNIYRTISDNNRENLSRVPGWFCFDFTLHGLRGLNTAKSISKALYGLSYLAGGARLLGVHHSHGKKALYADTFTTKRKPIFVYLARISVSKKQESVNGELPQSFMEHLRILISKLFSRMNSVSPPNNRLHGIYIHNERAVL
ncbi:hypothetical protein I7I50_06857 [Histoplasma capsulatum G186AR]|uniref:Uncharacterized protein n=1 Tax=Ajellomyces capsulatus TaxID=5037 RepID=A0A8H7Z0B1_AJECA|nr:hypothetical protein I7I52_10069 [Histoplasma capsulatum]QSS67696.1 hypothetical protein I7I50_06857 [Histoplasma capsulatum G186AR]